MLLYDLFLESLLINSSLDPLEFSRNIFETYAKADQISNWELVINDLEAKYSFNSFLTTMKKDFGIRIVYNPEFLTEANAHHDFLNPNMQVLGGKWKDCEAVEKAYIRHSSVKIVPTFKVDLITASLIKYTINSWLATKVTFFHELYSKLDKTYNYHMIINTLADFQNIGPSHMRVKQLGYDGNCFPKDMEAFANFLDSELLKSVIKVNESLVSSR